MTAPTPDIVRTHRLRNAALLAGGVGIAAAAVGWVFSPEAFFRAYLHSWLLWLGVSLGSLALTMVIALLGGSWGAAIDRPARAASMVLPLMAVLFVPIGVAAATGSLFPWAHAPSPADDPVEVLRRPYLNAPFFIARAVLYFVCWIGAAWLLRGSMKSRAARLGRAGFPSPGTPGEGRGEGDVELQASFAGRKHPQPNPLAGSRPIRSLLPEYREREPDLMPDAWRPSPLPGPMLVLYLLTMGLFASTDWILSLEPHYKSTVYGMIVVVGQSVSALCVLIPAAVLLGIRRSGENAVSADDRNDLATILLTATMLWCYLEICQFVINWMGNTQDENRWYLQRMSNGWHEISWLIVGLHLVLPLALLLFRRVKRSPAALTGLCLVLLLTRALDGFWTINPGGADATPLLADRFSWLDAVLPAAIGSLWIAAFTWLLQRTPEPVYQPQPMEGATVAV